MTVQELINQLEKVIITNGNIDIKVGVYDTYEAGSIVDVCYSAISPNNECVIVV